MQGSGYATGPFGNQRRCSARAVSTIAGSTPRSKRNEASVDKPWRLAILRVTTGLKYADSRKTRVVDSDTPLVSTSKHTGQAHGLCGVGNDLVVGVQGAFLSVERCQLFASTWVPNHDGIAFDGIRVKSVQGLAQFVQNVIGGIHNVVFEVHPDGPQPLLDGIRRWTNTNAFDQGPKYRGQPSPDSMDKSMGPLAVGSGAVAGALTAPTAS